MNRLLIILTAILLSVHCAAKGSKFERDQRVVDGTASGEDIKDFIDETKKKSPPVKPPANSNRSYVLRLPQTGQLKVNLKENKAGWRSELFIDINGAAINLFSDTRQGPLDTVTEFAYVAQTPVNFHLVTHTPAGDFTQLATGTNARIETLPNQKWRISFEDIPADVAGLPAPDWDFNDAVIEVEVVDSAYLDLSQNFNITMEYLDHHGYNEQGYVIYYIGETMKYNVKIDVLADHSYFHGRKFTVYAIHEYLDDVTFDRWYYLSPPRPASEPSKISVKKGDVLPLQDTPASWANLVFRPGESQVLKASYNGGLAVVPGNDQTHVLIVSQNAQGQIEATIFDNPQAGIFDPPLSP